MLTMEWWRRGEKDATEISRRGERRAAGRRRWEDWGEEHGAEVWDWVSGS